jgi:hypothetical protein
VESEGIFCVGLKVENEYLLFAAADENISETIELRDGDLRFTQEVSLKGGEAKLLRFSAPNVGSNRHVAQEMK